MGKAHRVRMIRAFTDLAYSRNLTPRFERQLRHHPLYQEALRLIGAVAVQKILDRGPGATPQ
jgi:hypothetical protein